VNPTTRPPPSVLFVHNGEPYAPHIKHLTDAGLRVTESHADSALADALKLQPDLVVLDFSADGETTAQLKGHARTRHIPIIALADFSRQT
jgi:CheY-like chemotaxis protein